MPQSFFTVQTRLAWLAKACESKTDGLFVRAHVMIEELSELAGELHTNEDEVDLFDAVCDVAYGTHGTAAWYGIEPASNFNLPPVHEFTKMLGGPVPLPKLKSATMMSITHQLADMAFDMAHDAWPAEVRILADMLRQLLDQTSSTLRIIISGHADASELISETTGGVIGTAHMVAEYFDFPFEDGLQEVHASNMTKTVSDPFVHDKGSEYVGPKLREVLDAWRNRQR